MSLLDKLRRLLVDRILGVADTPQRIAFGVFLGFVVAWTPTIGFQIVLYLAIASLLRANKVVGIPILFISNPLTAVPLYWFCWWLGAWVLHGGEPGTMSAGALEAQLDQGNDAAKDWMAELLTTDFWEGLGETLLAMGGELWLGSLIVGVVTGLIGYGITYWAVRSYRARLGADV